MDNTGSKTGVLYVVATPIGNLSDTSSRALATLREVHCIAAEDTRHTGKLCARYAIDTPMVSYHEHNEEQRTPKLLERLLNGEDVALVSDAGTPLVSDPGYRLVAAAHDVALKVVPIPGPCAAIAALSASGLASHRFLFEGFLPAKAGARRKRLDELRRLPDTLVLYESSHRLRSVLADLCQAFGDTRRATLARELTKLHETIHRDTLGALAERVAADPSQRKGEHVILVEGAVQPDDDDSERVFDILCRQLPLSQAAELAAAITGAGRNQLYRRGLEKRGPEGGGL